MGEILDVTITGVNAKSFAYSRQPLETVTEETLKEQGLLPYVEGAFALREPGKPTAYYAASVMAALTRFSPGLGKQLKSIPIDSLKIPKLGFVPIPPGLLQERIHYLGEREVLSVTDGKIRPDQFDFLLEDVAAAALGIPRTYQHWNGTEEVLDASYPELILFYSTEQVTLRKRQFLQGDRIRTIQKKVEGELDVSTFYNERRIQRRATIEEAGKPKNPHAQTDKTLSTSDPSLDKQLQERMGEMDDDIVDDIEEERELSGEIFDNYGHLIDSSEYTQITRRLKYAVDTGISGLAMRKALKEVMGFVAPTDKIVVPKAKLVEAYEGLIQKMYVLTISDVVDLVHHKAQRSRVRFTESLIEDAVVSCRPVEFMGALYFSGQYVEEVLEDMLPDLDELAYMPLGDALTLIQEAEGLYHVSPQPWMSRELLELLPKYSLQRGGMVPSKEGKFVSHDELDQGIIAMLKHRYHHPTVQRAETSEFLGGKYIILDERARHCMHSLPAIKRRSEQYEVGHVLAAHSEIEDTSGGDTEVPEDEHPEEDETTVLDRLADDIEEDEDDKLSA